MKSPRLSVVPATFAAAIMGAAVALAALAHADPDTDFAYELKTYGIYGARDYNAWLGKITCERLRNGVDGDADKSVHFISQNLQKGTTQAQAWKFLGASINTYCPGERPVYERAAAQH
ncbi:DUF732 domain-containing protein [Mycobacterium sp. M1]|uniref:DUF732 domain-containing protein n=1 Tax=Mycolicibacter acidiphilus TaxID=2835306 RepID=A0ABS5RL08_9MYCO|nr:DUF732 domain-containing protein [Mycolicibacter acidiphilus]MBS9534993.1 DUF732 domain-containing protein [Mycolicibacter acidiphilus]